MKKKVVAVLGTAVLLAGVNGYAQTIKVSPKVVEKFSGGVPSSFSTVAPVSFVKAETLGRKVLAAQVALVNSRYLSSAVLFQRVAQANALQALPAKEFSALETKFAQLDLSVQTKVNEHLGYLGALWNTTPAVEAATLAHEPVQQMIQLLDIQRYMQLNNNQFPHVFTITEGGWLTTTSCLMTPEGNSAFLAVVDLLVKEQAHQVSPAVLEQLVTLHSAAQNSVPVTEVVKQLENWRTANKGKAPTLPADMGGVSLRNAETLWLAAEIRLLQLTPGLELPEVLKAAK